VKRYRSSLRIQKKAPATNPISQPSTSKVGVHSQPRAQTPSVG
jgi:hypothetical protein